MKHTALFRLLSMITILFYGAALAQAGQVITQDERSWADKAVQDEKALSTVPNSNTIAVLYFANKTGKAKLTPLEKGLAVMLITDLARVDQIQVVERIRIQALLDEMELGETGLVDARTAPRVGQMLGAYYLTRGDILEGKIKDLEIDSTILDVPFNSVTKQPSTAGVLDELFKMEKEILFNIIEQMNIYLSPAKKAELEKPLSISTAALLALFLGIGHSDKGEYVEAAKMYEQALVEDPDLEMAKNALQELKGMGLISAEESPATQTGAESGGSSAGTIIGVGVALALVGGGVALALGSSSSDDDDSTTNQPPEPGDTTPPTVQAVAPAENTFLNCNTGTISIAFSESMSQTGSVTVSPKDFVQSQRWSGEKYVLSWQNDSTYCYYPPSSVVITLGGFQDLAENPLSGQTEFSYYVD